MIKIHENIPKEANSHLYFYSYFLMSIKDVIYEKIIYIIFSWNDSTPSERQF